MARSTILLAGLCLLLAGATSFVIWWGISNHSESVLGVSEGAVAVGLPDLGPKNSERIVSAGSAILWDSESEVIRYESHAFEQRPIASITKLMTAMVVIDNDLDWDKEVEIRPEEYVIGGKLQLHPGEFVTARDLFHASLMGSANNATIALARSVDLSEKEFVQQMNRKAISLGLENTKFTEVTGLDEENVSTAYEVARMAEAAWRDYPEIAEISGKLKYVYLVGGSGREHTILNTNNMITEQEYVLGGSKTGYLYEAGFCLVVRGYGDRKRDIAVALGADSEWDSMEDIKLLLNKSEK